MKSTKTTFLKGLKTLTMVGLLGLVLGSSLVPLRQASADIIMVTGSITASPGTICAGETSNISWATTDATSIVIDPIIGSVSAYGNRDVSPTQTTTYTMTLSNSTGGYGQTSATVYVSGSCQPPAQNPTVTLSANPTSIQSGQSSTLTWNSTNANSCSASWSGSSATSGSQTVYPTSTTTYSITCYGDSGTTPATASVTVNVSQVQNTPTVSLYANPTSITSGQNSTLTWTSTYATSCSAYWTGSTATSGSGVVVPSGTTTYSITCYGTNGQQVNASATVSVNQVQNTPTVNLSANPTSIQSGQSSTLNWNSQNATYCSSSWSGSSSVSGYQTVYPTYTTNYTINCYGTNGQQISDSATVYVNNNQTCQDTSANNYRGTLPCTYTYYNQTCQDPSAINYRGTLPCSYPQLQVCQDTNAINYRGVLPCRYYTPIINNQPTVVLYADQASVPYNGAATVRWLTTNATSCNASGGSVGWAGTKSIGPGSFYTGSLTGSRTYTITCNNNYGSATDSVSITVRGQVLGATTVRTAPTSLVLITSSVDRNQPIVPTLDNTRPHPGDEINYTVNYQNIGTGAITGLSLRIDLPYEVDYMFSTPNNPTRSGNTLIFNLGTLKANGQGTVTVRVRVRDNIPAGTNLNFPATLSYIDPSGFPQSVTANVSAQVWSAPVVPAPVDTNANIFLGANVFGVGFLPGNLFGWLLLLILILLLVLLAKYLFGQSSGQPFSSKKTTTTFDQPLGKKTTTTTVQQ